ncbi:MAG: FtsX-like permease family protein [Bryobacteraceae bacterium]|nr:FtsX-like permease family protein [Bryobacteraceae bacterium]
MPPGGEWPRDARVALVNIVSPGFLEAMGMTLRTGTGFTRHDTETSQPVIMVNEILARQIWPGKDPIGQSAFMDSTHSRRVVGVVANVRETSPEEQSGAAFFLPITQTRDLAGSSDQSSGKAHLIIRTKLPLDAIAPGVRAVFRALNPNQPVRDFQLLEELIEQVTSPRRFFALLVTAFALLGLLLASLGIYGVISYSVARRTQEIGIRMALGASAREVQMSVIQQTFRMALIGIGVGTLASLAAAKLVSSLLFNIRPTDPVTFIGMVMVLGLVALIAGYVPARRASQVDPVTALRAE